MIASGENGGLLDIVDETLEKAINFIALIEDHIGDLKYLFKPLKKVVGQVKQTLMNIRGLIQMVQTCNAGAALAGIFAFGFLMWMMSVVLVAAVKLIAVACTVLGPGAPACIFVASYVVLPYVLELVNYLLRETLEDIVDGPLCNVPNP